MSPEAWNDLACQTARSVPVFENNSNCSNSFYQVPEGIGVCAQHATVFVECRLSAAVVIVGVAPHCADHSPNCLLAR